MSIRPSAEQRAEIIRRAAAAGVSVNHYLLTAALAHSGFAPKPPPRTRTIDPATLAELQALRAELGRIGNNLNQLVLSTHIGQLPDGTTAADVLSGVSGLARQITATLKGRESSRQEGGL